jgi:hypothetical protein
MFERWRQENFFKYMREEFLLDALLATIVSIDPIRFEFTFDEASYVRYERLAKGGRDMTSRAARWCRSNCWASRTSRIRAGWTSSTM